MVALRERGSAMILALLTLLMVTMAVLLVAQLIQQRIDALKGEERQVMTTALADACMAETLAHLDDNRFYRGLSSQALGKGWIESSVSGMQPGSRRVVAKGRAMGWQTNVTAEVDLRFDRPSVVSWTYRSGPQE